ncbi:uncharacterized protein Gpdh3 [Drosophila bipectinata]|uniref:uncharacterized protein Gpdh3 n=1 Tax=Drosophila bipectinata TaxID=42026 RepID=UPI001C89C0A4|nr:uncharacterized protein LOC108119837 [Drosophila bipectinata]
MSGKLKVCIIGAEGWGSAIAAAVSKNVRQGNFNSRVHIYVLDELVRSSPLSEVINDSHENVKYLPGIKLPKNLVAVNDLLEAAQNADILIFAMPQSFVNSYCNILEGNLKETAFAVSMVKGLMEVCDDDVVLVSQAISERLGIPCYSMMSAHSAMEMAQGKLCEITLGCTNPDHGELLVSALQTNNCKVISVDDVHGVELVGTLKDIISLGAGLVDGLRLGDNARVAAIHLGLKEMMRFIETYFPSAKMSTSAYVDKNVTFANSFITSGQSIQEIESNLQNGLLGPLVVSEVNAILEADKNLHKFPLFTAIHQVCHNEAPPDVIMDALKNHPDLRNSSVSHLLNDETGEKMSSQVLDEVADTLPKLRKALDKILAEAGDKSFKNLKILGSWSPKNSNLETPTENQVPIETEDIPDPLSAKALQIQKEIRDGNVKVAFTMDVADQGRHMRLLLKEAPRTSTPMGQSVVSEGMGSGKGKDVTRIGKSAIMDSKLESMDMDSLDLSTEANNSDPRLQEMKLIDDSIQSMDMESSHSGQLKDDKEARGETEMVGKLLSDEEPTDHESNEKEWKLLMDELEDQEETKLTEKDPEMSKYFTESEPIDVNYLEEWQTTLEHNKDQEARLRLETSENDPENRKSKYFTVSEPIEVNYPCNEYLDLTEKAQFGDENDLEQLEKKFQQTYTVSEQHESDKETLPDTESFQISEVRQEGKASDLQLRIKRKTQKTSEGHLEDCQDVEESDRLRVRAKNSDSPWTRESFNYVEGFDAEPSVKRSRYSDLLVRAGSQKPYNSKKEEGLDEAIRDRRQERNADDWEPQVQYKNIEVMDKHVDGFGKSDDEDMRTLKSSNESETRYGKLEEDEQQMEHLYEAKMAEDLQEPAEPENRKLVKGKDMGKIKEKVDLESQRIAENKYMTNVQEQPEIDNWKIVVDKDLIKIKDNKDIIKIEDKDIIQVQEESELENWKMVEESSEDNLEEDKLWKHIRSMEEGRDEELVKAAEEKRSTKMGERRPLLSLEEVNMRYYSDQKDGEGSHEWDWLLNNERIGKPNSETLLKADETLSRADEENLEKLSDQLAQALEKEKTKKGEDSLKNMYNVKDTGLQKAILESKSLEDLAEVSADHSKKDLEEEQDAKASKKRVPPREFEVPSPAATPAYIPREGVKQKSKIQEGTPQVQTQPKTAPTQPPQIRPHKVEEMNPILFESEQPQSKKDEPVAKSSEPPKKVEEPPKKVEAPARRPAGVKMRRDEPSAPRPAAERMHNTELPPARRPAGESMLKREEPPARRPAGERMQKGEEPPARRPAGERTHKHEEIPQPSNSKSDRKRHAPDYIQIKKRKVPETPLDRAQRDMNSIMRKVKSRPVNYRGKNPFHEGSGTESNAPMDDTSKTKQAGENWRRRVVSTPLFNPPINPRVRVPRPPFDGRDQEYHTLSSTMITSLVVPIMQKHSMPMKNALQSPIVSKVQLKQLSAMTRSVQAIRRPSLKMPSGVPRSPTLTKILCALHIGLLASYLARFRK